MVTATGLRFVGPRRVEPVDVDLDPVAEGQVLVRTRFSGISAGTELLAYRAEIDADLPLDETIGALGGTFRYPFRYGYSCVGVVEESRSPLAEGTPVFAFQPHQDRFVADAAGLVVLPAVDARAATLFPLVETALQITLDAGPLLHEPVVVFGLGAVGLLSAVLLGRGGARVLGVDPLAARRDAAARLGIDAVTPDEVSRSLAARGVDAGVPLVVEASGRPAVLAAGLPLLAHEGTALVASWYGTKEVTLPLGAEFHRRRLTIRSTQVSSIPARLGDRWTHDRRRRATRDLLADLPLEVVATHTFPFADAARAYAALDQGDEKLIHAALWYG